MTRIFTAFFPALMSILLWTGCATTGDPNVDSIGFSPERAERERLAPRRDRLRREEGGAEAERIRSLALKQEMQNENETRRSDEGEIRRLRAEKASSERELNRLNAEVASARARGEKDDELIRERNRRQEEVDRLSTLLHRLLRNE